MTPTTPCVGCGILSGPKESHTCFKLEYDTTFRNVKFPALGAWLKCLDIVWSLRSTVRILKNCLRITPTGRLRVDIRWTSGDFTPKNLRSGAGASWKYEETSPGVKPC